MLVHIEVGVHGVHGHDRREQSPAALISGLDQVAHRDNVSAYAAADRCRHLRVFQVQLGPFDTRLQRFARCECLAPIADDLVEVFLANRGGRDQAARRARSESSRSTRACIDAKFPSA